MLVTVVSPTDTSSEAARTEGRTDRVPADSQRALLELMLTHAAFSSSAIACRVVVGLKEVCRRVGVGVPSTRYNATWLGRAFHEKSGPLLALRLLYAYVESDRPTRASDSGINPADHLPLSSAG
ncbi:hypothetical protein NMY22_g17676 [Coprinellus aureogranulatus]|nr:hypothetical protein NMY22_g17676 [Coprinellus aureogranulatus]